MITTSQLAAELGINQRSIQNRILRLGIKCERAGNAFVLSEKQAARIRAYGRKLCAGCGTALTETDRVAGACTQCSTLIKGAKGNG